MHRNRFQNHKNLKSNMDRFIVRLEESIIRSRRNLKSNMDRFIDPSNDFLKLRLQI